MTSTVSIKHAGLLLWLLSLSLLECSQGFGGIRKQHALAQPTSKSKRSSTTRNTSTALKQVNTFAASILGKLYWKQAERSAGIYMDPASTKVANITISWEPSICEKILELKKDKHYDVSRPFMVGVVGIPGSGKSTSSEILANVLPNCVTVPLDGYHIPMKELEESEDALDRIYRRGAPDTFDPASVIRDLDRIVHGSESTVCLPGFDHAVGDPTPDQHTFYRNLHQTVICEGIYLMHQEDGWERVKDYMDYIIYIDVDIDKSIARLKERNKCIPGYTPEEIEIRCEEVDRTNAEKVARSRPLASTFVTSGAA